MNISLETIESIMLTTRLNWVIFVDKKVCGGSIFMNTTHNPTGNKDKEIVCNRCDIESGNYFTWTVFGHCMGWFSLSQGLY